MLIAETESPVIDSTAFFTLLCTSPATSGIFTPYSTTIKISIVASFSPTLTFTPLERFFFPLNIWVIPPTIPELIPTMPLTSEQAKPAITATT